VGLFASLDAFWVDPFETVKHAMNKQLQLEIAREMGLAIPDTLTTNDPVANVSRIVVVVNGPNGRTATLTSFKRAI